ncbi:MAG: hypothetical protein WC536_03110 [Patescibacteria group bacterium]|jgi:hypothetical protein
MWYVIAAILVLAVMLGSSVFSLFWVVAWIKIKNWINAEEDDSNRLFERLRDQLSSRNLQGAVETYRIIVQLGDSSWPSHALDLIRQYDMNLAEKIRSQSDLVSNPSPSQV